MIQTLSIKQIHSYQIYRIVWKAIYIMLTDTCQRRSNFVLNEPPKQAVRSYCDCMFRKAKLFHIRKDDKFTKAFIEQRKRQMVYSYQTIVAD